MSIEPIHLIIAIIFSLSPLFFGIKKNKHFLAILGFIATIMISTAMHVAIAVLIAAIFTWLILKEDPASDKKGLVN